MKLSEAIEILNHLTDPSYFLISTDERAALKLGVKAIERWQEYRARGMGWWGNLLPGETEE